MDVVPITTVLLLGNRELAHEAGKPLWVVFEEVAKFYNRVEERAELERYVVVQTLPESFGSEPDGGEFIELSDDQFAAVWENTRGRYSGTVDQGALAAFLRGELHLPKDPGDALVVVTDKEITPPPDWRYILWDYTSSGWVVSIAAMDPAYWGITDPERASVIKHRARVACMAVVGLTLGLKRCQNEQCYLFEQVDSVNRLDLMVSLGPEHEEFSTEQLVGYSSLVLDPAIEQELASRDDLQSEGWAALS